MAEKSDFPDHHCPGCGTAQKEFLRYPWYFCVACRDTACDGTGRRILAGNTSFSGGFEWRFEDADPSEAVTCAGVICLINRRPVYMHEARFGGIAVEPLNSMHEGWSELWDLRGAEPRPPIKRRRS